MGAAWRRRASVQGSVELCEGGFAAACSGVEAAMLQRASTWGLCGGGACEANLWRVAV